jgi:hypothetical protein
MKGSYNWYIHNQVRRNRYQRGEFVEGVRVPLIKSEDSVGCPLGGVVGGGVSSRREKERRAWSMRWMGET